MYIKSIANNTVDRFGRVIRVVTDHAKYKGYNIAIEHTYRNGVEQEKTFVAWDKFLQLIVPKVRKADGKGFRRIG